MTKRDLVVRIASETGHQQQVVAEILDRVLDGIIASLERGETVEFRNFGVFKIQRRKARIGRNPNKPENTVVIPDRKVVKFKVGKVMRQKVTGK